ncbi:methyltransferase, partial [Crinivirus abutilonis]
SKVPPPKVENRVGSPPPQGIVFGTLDVADERLNEARIGDASVNKTYADVLKSKRPPVKTKGRGAKNDLSTTGKRQGPKPDSVKQVWRPEPSKPFCEVRHHIGERGDEYFTIRYENGKTAYVNNGPNAVVDMFNLTLDNQRYTIHPMCLTPNGKRFYNYPNSYCWLDAFAMAKTHMPKSNPKTTIT